VGGCGKTRLALQLAAEAADQYGGGVWLVELAAVSEGARVPAAVATALGERDQAGDLVELLADRLGQEPVLVVLDNCEHLLGPVAALVDVLLRRCPALTVVATSREPLGVPGETGWRVPALSRPEPSEVVSVDGLLCYDAVRLFVERATQARPDFALTADNVGVVAQICARLDGIPLALELAAARVRGLTVGALATAVDDRFRLLTGGSRTVLERQRTLQAPVDWSYELLAEPERALFARLAMFAGSSTWTPPWRWPRGRPCTPEMSWGCS
jgi:predicted ATPase